MNLLDVIKANMFGNLEAKNISDTQLANYLAVDIFEREHIEANESEICFLEKRLRLALHCLNITLIGNELN